MSVPIESEARFREFTNLRVLSIRYDMGPGWSVRHYETPLPLLRGLPESGQLRRLVFKPIISARELTNQELYIFCLVDDALVRPPFRDITEVAWHFEVQVTDSHESLGSFTSKEGLRELIERNMPSLSARHPSVLRVDITVHA